MLANTAKAKDSHAGLADWIAGIAKRVDPADLRAPGNSVIQILTTALEKEKAADKPQPVLGLGTSGGTSGTGGRR